MNQIMYKKMIDKLLDVVAEEMDSADTGLTDWEMDFITSVNDWQGDLTAGQCAAIERIFNKIFDADEQDRFRNQMQEEFRKAKL